MSGKSGQGMEALMKNAGVKNKILKFKLYFLIVMENLQTVQITTKHAHSVTRKRS